MKNVAVVRDGHASQKCEHSAKDAFLFSSNEIGARFETTSSFLSN